MKQAKNARCFVKMIKTSPRKLNLVAGLVRSKGINQALNALMLSKRRVAEAVKKAVLSAVANAENNHGMQPEKLIISEAYVGKAMTLKRMRPGSRGQAKRISKPFSNLTIVVSEKEVKPEVKKEKVSPKTDASKKTAVKGK